MNTTKAAVITSPGNLEILELEMPTLQDGGVLLQVLLTEVCGTDVHLLKGHLPEAPYPLIPGHFAVGRVLETRGEVCDVDGKPIECGEIVTFLDVYGTCGQCWFCQVAHASTKCPNRRVYGITFGLRDGIHGAWSELMHLKPGTRIIPLRGISPETFMGGGCGLVTALHAVERAGVQLADSVVVQGSGPVGVNAALLARMKGAAEVILIGAPQSRLEVGLQFGADHVVDVNTTTPDERVALVRELTEGRGADVVIEATGNPNAISEGLMMVRDAGVYVVAGQYTDAGDIVINPHQLLNKKHVDVRAVWGIDYSHLHRAIRLMKHRGSEIKWESLISQTYPLSQARAAIEDVSSGKVMKAALAPVQLE